MGLYCTVLDFEASYSLGTPDKPSPISLLLLAINKLHVFNTLMSDWLKATGRCVLSDISWQRALVTERAKQRGGRGRLEREGRVCVCIVCIWVFWQGKELVCLAGPSHLGSICVSLESDRRL